LVVSFIVTLLPASGRQQTQEGGGMGPLFTELLVAEHQRALRAEADIARLANMHRRPPFLSRRRGMRLRRLAAVLSRPTYAAPVARSIRRATPAN
jgi:hypothetical protein